MFVECLIDSESPISFIKKSLVPAKLNLKNVPDATYYGINKSKLQMFGQFLCYVTISNKEVLDNLIVVADGSMVHSAVLGRDFLKASKSKLVLGEYDNAIVMKKSDSSMMKNDCLHSDSDNDFEKQILAISYEPDDNTPLIIGHNVSYVDQQNFRKLFSEFYVSPQRPSEPKIKCEMKLVLENTKPFNCPPRRLSYFEKNVLQKILDDYIKNGYIRASESEFVSPIVLVKKKTGDLRMCIDFRVLNRITAKDSYPIPLIDDLLDRLAGKTIFSKLELKNGFFHVFMHKDSIKYTSFVTPLGQFEFLRMPFGLKNAPSTFQKFVNKIFFGYD